jgi:low affinity Fe/Cu permease
MSHTPAWPPPENASSSTASHRFNEIFRKFANRTAAAVGSKYAFALSIMIVLVWAALGPHYRYSDTWQLVINTGTTIVTFLMVFLIQNTQNRDAKAIHLKLDELIRGVKGARTGLVDLEDLSDEDLAKLQDQFHHIRERHTRAVDNIRKQADKIEQKGGDPDAVPAVPRGLRDEADEVKQPLQSSNPPTV